MFMSLTVFLIIQSTQVTNREGVWNPVAFLFADSELKWVCMNNLSKTSLGNFHKLNILLSKRKNMF